MTKQISYFLAYLCRTVFFIQVKYVLFALLSDKTLPTLDWQRQNLPPLLVLKKIFLTQFWIVVDTYVIVLVFQIFLPGNIPNRRSRQVKNFGAERTTVLSSSRQKISLKSGRNLWYSLCTLCITPIPGQKCDKFTFAWFFPSTTVWFLKLELGCGDIKIDRKCVLSAIIFYEINKTNYYEVTTQLFRGCFKAVLKIVLNVVLKVVFQVVLDAFLMLSIISFWFCPWI